MTSKLRAQAIAAACTLALAACQHAPPRNPMATWVPSPNHDVRRPVLIVLHYTEQGSVEQSLRTLSTRNSGGPVSSHYLVGDDGRIYQLVSDEHRAWHAGAGSWGTISDVNSASIGIEIDNDGVEPFTEPQIAALLRLLEDLTTRWRIPRSNVVGHSDVAPARKVDPGVLFPWQRLAEAGFGVWPGDVSAVVVPDGFDPLQALRLLGYEVHDPAAAFRAFNLRFRASNAGDLDETGRRMLFVLANAGAAPPAP